MNGHDLKSQTLRVGFSPLETVRQLVDYHSKSVLLVLQCSRWTNPEQNSVGTGQTSEMAERGVNERRCDSNFGIEWGISNMEDPLVTAGEPKIAPLDH